MTEAAPRANDVHMRFILLALSLLVLSACDKAGGSPSASPDSSSKAEVSKTASNPGSAKPGSAKTDTSSALSPGSASAASGDDSFVVVDVPIAANASVLDVVKGEVAKAKAKHLKPFVEFAAGWCEPCLAIKKSLDDPRMKAAFAGSYIVRLDADEWGEHLGGSGFAPHAIPVFYEVGDDGKPTGRTIDGAAWEDNLPENMAPPLSKFFHAT